MAAAAASDVEIDQNFRGSSGLNDHLFEAMADRGKFGGGICRHHVRTLDGDIRTRLQGGLQQRIGVAAEGDQLEQTRSAPARWSRRAGLSQEFAGILADDTLGAATRAYRADRLHADIHCATQSAFAGVDQIDDGKPFGERAGRARDPRWRHVHVRSLVPLARIFMGLAVDRQASARTSASMVSAARFTRISGCRVDPDSPCAPEPSATRFISSRRPR